MAGKLLKISCAVFVRAGEDQDPEDIASRFNNGLGAAVENFPDAPVVGAEVEVIAEAGADDQERFAEDDLDLD